MSDTVRYEHRQVAWPILIGMIGTAALIGAAGIVNARLLDAPVTLLVSFLLLIGILMSSMTVRVTDSEVSWWFGRTHTLGKTVALADIASVEAIRTSLFEGWGIHLTWHGWLWNVSGFNAVQIKLGSGTRYAVGTPEPQALLKAIRKAQKKKR